MRKSFRHFIKGVHHGALRVRRAAAKERNVPRNLFPSDHPTLRLPYTLTLSYRLHASIDIAHASAEFWDMKTRRKRYPCAEEGNMQPDAEIETRGALRV